MEFKMPLAPTFDKSHLSYYREQEKYCDFTIHCGVKSYKVHKALLALHSNFFYDYFSEEAEIKSRVLNLYFLDVHKTKLFLYYIYKGKWDLANKAKTESEVIECLDVIPLYKEMFGKDPSTRFMNTAIPLPFQKPVEVTKSLTSSNMVPKQTILQKRASRFEEFSCSNEFSFCTFDYFKAILNSDVLVASADSICTAIKTWTKHNPSGRSQEAENLLGVVTVQSLSNRVLHELIADPFLRVYPNDFFLNIYSEINRRRESQTSLTVLVYTETSPKTTCSDKIYKIACFDKRVQVDLCKNIQKTHICGVYAQDQMIWLQQPNFLYCYDIETERLVSVLPFDNKTGITDKWKFMVVKQRLYAFSRTTMRKYNLLKILGTWDDIDTPYADLGDNFNVILFKEKLILLVDDKLLMHCYYPISQGWSKFKILSHALNVTGLGLVRYKQCKVVQQSLYLLIEFEREIENIYLVQLDKNLKTVLQEWIFTKGNFQLKTIVALEGLEDNRPLCCIDNNGKSWIYNVDSKEWEVPLFAENFQIVDLSSDMASTKIHFLLHATAYYLPKSEEMDLVEMQ